MQNKISQRLAAKGVMPRLVALIYLFGCLLSSTFTIGC